jgi:hypothetical protein
VRRGVGAEEELGIARSRRAAQRQPVMLALGHGQAVGMRADAADEHGVAVDVQVLRGDRRRDIRAGGFDEGHRFLCRGVLEHDLEPLHLTQQRCEDALDEHRLAVEHVDRGVGHLAVDAEHHADVLHPLEHAADIGDVGHAAGRVGRRAGRIELGRGERAIGKAGGKIVRVGGVGQVAGHQRCEVRSFGQRREDP